MKKIRHILIGWLKKYGWLPTSEEGRKLSELRLKICTGCKYSAVSEILEFIDTQGEYKDVLKCTLCSCPCKQKSLVTSEQCPLQLW